MAILAVALGALALSVARPASADLCAFTCPDGHTHVPSLFSPKQDRNTDGLVCQKSNGRRSGSDDMVNPAVIDDPIV
jgi:hypothetical protein